MEKIVNTIDKISFVALKNLKSLFKKEQPTRTQEGYDIYLFDEFHKLNNTIRVMNQQLGELGNNEYYDSMVLELKAKEAQRDVIFKRLKTDFYENKTAQV